jgi:hypothetical protein
LQDHAHHLCNGELVIDNEDTWMCFEWIFHYGLRRPVLHIGLIRRNVTAWFTVRLTSCPEMQTEIFHSQQSRSFHRYSLLRKTLGAESRGIPHLARNERDVGHPGSCLGREKHSLAR